MTVENTIPKVWNNISGNDGELALRMEASRRFRQWAELPCGSKKEWNAHRQFLRKTIWEKVGVKYDSELPLDCREYGTVRMKGYSIRKLAYQSRKGFYVTANLYVPDGKGPFPGVINMHGHWQQGKIAERVQARGHLLAQSGYVCLCVDAFGAGERASEHSVFEYHGRTLGASLLNIGESLMGCQVVDNMRGVDLLCSLPYVDKQKIGATGASGGGNQTMWLTAMDDRIQASVPVVSVGSFDSYVHSINCVCELLTDGLTFTEESGVLALAAPRALKICTALMDSNEAFQAKEMLRSWENARRVFRLLDSDEKFTYQIFNTTHGYWAEIRETMLGWFNLHLKGKGLGMPEAEPPFECVPEGKLMVFPKGECPAEVRSIAAHCRIEGAKLRAAMLRKKSFVRREKVQELKTILRMGAPLSVADATEHNELDGWKRFTLTFSDGRQLPLAVKPQGKEFILMTHPHGKEKIAIPDTDASLALADLSGHGENQPNPNGITPYHDFARWQLWLGRTVIGEWVRELEALRGFLTEHFKAKTVTLHGAGETAVASLFASIVHGKIDRVVYEDAPGSYLFSGTGIPEYFNMAMPVPGFLRWGDIPLAIALSTAKVEILRPKKMDGKLFEAEERLRKEIEQLRRELTGRS
ncbi:MAG: Acetyl xylan esterase (AXE1) [Lentisphaerae bacterium ADurb.Bin242]|nr:MAG: Acetyl xylan esterase (AXE1) [Lentisphaerae bacterium ADurb.Bin242]